MALKASRVILVLIILAVLAVSSYAVYHVAEVSAIHDVALTGKVTVNTSLGENPVANEIVFTRVIDGGLFASQVREGAYSITLPNGYVYSVAINYTASLYGGTLVNKCNAGSLDLNQFMVKLQEQPQTPGMVTLVYNISCSTDS